MVGIISHGLYLPSYQMSADMLRKAWGRPAGRGTRAISNYDEDSLTMAVGASLRCIRDFDYQRVDALYFASSTPPYGEKMNASVIATALDLKRTAFTMDVGSSLRSGSNAMRAALDAVSSGSMRNVLVAASDRRFAEPGSYLEPFLGDGAVALLLGQEDPIAELVAHHSVFDGFPDVWRKQGERFLHHDDVRYSRSEDYARSMKSAVNGLLSESDLKMEDFSKVVLSPMDARGHSLLASSLAIEPDRLQEPFLDRTGMIGSAHGLMMLSAALDQAESGQLILFANYGDGADAFVMRVKRTEERGALSEIERERKPIRSYAMYLSFRDLVGGYELSTPFTAIPLLRREEELNLRLHGRKCKVCGRVNTLALKVCSHCRKPSDFEDVKLSKRGRVVTYSQEYYFPAPEPPVTMAVVDLEGGGRILTQMTDAGADEVRVDMQVELTLRKLHTGGGFVNYSWKCRPAGGDAK